MDFSASGLLSSLLVSSIGYVLFHYGKRSVRTPQLVSGLVLMASSFLAPSAAWLLALGGVVLAGLWVCLRCGM